MSSRKNWHMFRTCLNRSQLGKRRHKWPRCGRTMSLNKTQVSLVKILIPAKGHNLVVMIVEINRVDKVSRTSQVTRVKAHVSLFLIILILVKVRTKETVQDQDSSQSSRVNR